MKDTQIHKLALIKLYKEIITVYMTDFHMVHDLDGKYKVDVPKLDG